MEEPLNQIGSEFIICPECHYFCKDMMRWKPVGDLMTGIVYGFFIICEYCNKKSFINLLNTPPLFDLSHQREGAFQHYE